MERTITYLADAETRYRSALDAHTRLLDYGVFGRHEYEESVRLLMAAVRTLRQAQADARLASVVAS